MKKRTNFLNIKGLAIVLCTLMLTNCSTSDKKCACVAGSGEDFNFGWKFILDSTIDASAADYNDQDWRQLDLPHDWSVEFDFDSVKGEGCTAYLLGGIGWYRKHFTTNITPNQKVYILFDGVYNRSEYWINGEKLGFQPYGYSPFYFDLTPYLNKSGENVIAVKVDHSRYADSRWYTGSGIYRNVKLYTTDKLHIPVWGTFATTPKAEKEQAVVNLEISVQNDYDEEQAFELKTKIKGPDGKTVANVSSKETLNKGENTVITQIATINAPALWGVDNPNLYKAVTKVIKDGDVVQSYVTSFGIRSFVFDTEKGFFLNGENMKIKGVCLHHDGGLVGAAVPKGVWKRRLQILKDGGCNAIRISHNPGSDEFLDLCDEMGFLVQDEFYDEWDYPKDKRLNMKDQHDDYITRGHHEFFQEYAEEDLKKTMLSHRNHPSIIQWSIGNEIEWTYPRNRKATGFFDNMDWSGNYFWERPPYTKEEIRAEYNRLPALEYNIETTAKKLAEWTKEIDTTRPVIANCILPSASFETGYADALDIVGFSYRRIIYDYAREFYPDKTVMGTENLPQWHEWKAIQERPFISGTFLWTGIDYMGESNDQWPRRNIPSGLIDQAGFANPSYHMYEGLWTDKTTLYVCSQVADKSQYEVNEEGKVVEKKPNGWEKALWFWHDVNEHWNYNEGDSVIVEVISSCEEVELFLNEKSLGVKELKDFPDRIYKWYVPFVDGKLTAKGVKGDETIESSIMTASDAVGVKITTDKATIEADNYDVAHIIVQLIDANGNPIFHTDERVTFNVSGPVKSLGVDNGSPRNVQRYQADNIITSEGRAMLIVQSTKDKGEATITVSGEGLEAASTTITIQ